MTYILVDSLEPGWERGVKESTSTVLIDTLHDPYVVELYSPSTDFIGVKTKSTEGVRPLYVGSCEIG